MDCVIPGHSVRIFSSAIQCLSKVGTDLYLDFDPMDGLALRSLNDAKSAFCHVEFSASFFERCTAPVMPATTRGRKRHHASSTATTSSSSTQESRLCCRLPMRALAPVVRARKGILALRIKSEGQVGNNHQSSNDNNNNNNNENAKLQLAFEFQLEVSNSAQQSDLKPTVCRVIHRVGVAEVDNIAAVAPKEEASELVAAPKVLMKWLEPIKRTAEGCLIFSSNADMVVATSFNSSDTSGTNLAVATKNLLKTETSINLEDLIEYDFQDHRQIPNDIDNHHNRTGVPPCPMPPNVNDEVVLVFGLKEVKAMLQFCSQNSSSSAARGDIWDDANVAINDGPRPPWSVTLSYHWAGRPLIWDAKHNGVSIQLVLATLSHDILKDFPMMQERSQEQQRQQQQQRRRKHS